MHSYHYFTLWALVQTKIKYVPETKNDRDVWHVNFLSKKYIIDTVSEYTMNQTPSHYSILLHLLKQSIYNQHGNETTWVLIGESPRRTSAHLFYFLESCLMLLPLSPSPNWPLLCLLPVHFLRDLLVYKFYFDFNLNSVGQNWIYYIFFAFNFV